VVVSLPAVVVVIEASASGPAGTETAVVAVEVGTAVVPDTALEAALPSNTSAKYSAANNAAAAHTPQASASQRRSLRRRRAGVPVGSMAMSIMDECVR